MRGMRMACVPVKGATEQTNCQKGKVERGRKEREVSAVPVAAGGEKWLPGMVTGGLGGVGEKGRV